MRVIVRALHDKRPQSLQKILVPSAIKSLDEHRADVKAANGLLIKELYGVVGESIFTSASGVRIPDKTAARLREIIGN